MKRKTKLAIKRAFLITAVFVVVLVGLSLVSTEKYEIKRSLISEQVLAYEPLVEKYARDYHIEEYTDVLLAIMMQESGGHGNDPMQASESYCGKVGCIDDPELSIKQGVYYFSKIIDEADGDVKLAIQSYNFGRGFIDYVMEKSGNFTQKAAIDFSRKMYQAASDQSIYTCLREEAKKFDACYGDIYYVRDVMEFVAAQH